MLNFIQAIETANLNAFLSGARYCVVPSLLAGYNVIKWNDGRATAIYVTI